MLEESEAADAKPALSPYEYATQTIGPLPSAQQIDAWKVQVPNGILRLMCPDGRRAYLLRGLTGIEMKEIEARVPAGSSDRELDLKLLAVAQACRWTNTTPTNQLDAVSLRTATAGLPHSLFLMVERLSDYYPPEDLLNMCIDL